MTHDRREGHDVYYGDAADPKFLEICGLANAAGVIITIHDRDLIDSVVEHVRAMRSDVIIVSRARDANHARHLYQLGATDAVPETVEASLQLPKRRWSGSGCRPGRSSRRCTKNAMNCVAPCSKPRARRGGIKFIPSKRRRHGRAVGPKLGWRCGAGRFPRRNNVENIVGAVHGFRPSPDRAQATRGFRDYGPARTDRYRAGRPACRAPAENSRASRSAD